MTEAEREAIRGYTAGTWHLRPWFDGKACVVTLDESGNANLVIAKVEDKCDSPDSLLIAASPALLAENDELRRVLRRLIVWRDDESQTEVGALEEIISSARAALGDIEPKEPTP